MRMLTISSLQFSTSLTRTNTNLAAKRAMDVVCSAAGLVVLAPLLGLITAAIKLDSPGPIFYHAIRVGQSGKLFHIHKFRTMVMNADRLGPGLTLANDQRVTRVGRFLRRSKFDELPQLINVLRGTMSLVGPRPEDPRYVALYTPDQRHVLELRPGITSLASVWYRHEEELLVGDAWEAHYVDTVMPTKLRIDLEYLQRVGPKQDLKVIARTIIALLR